ncbi:hypothetical protein QEV83_05735 [Methylocapsa sp. D3K7]|uniref:hypothetical protein n=1 Tax=Methylocapsa sp. D3K7 TaxID=3041435 RepID=UPI00244ECD8D|nr:hypothetical protein [Methylocapsa sp. D3K7]WGJ15760.1 hypothetical protein QEV83_05735 [Methylocapsa sp. D3K7]
MDIPIADVLSRTGNELAQLAGYLKNLQSHIGPLVQKAAACDANVLHQMQSLDHMAQKSVALADFLAALAREMPSGWRVDPGGAAQTVTLADLSSRLGFSSEGKDACTSGWGDCDFF